jgi:glutamate synthase (NADPH/NADH) small chain
MGETKGFLKYPRQDPAKEPVEERLKHYREFYKDMTEEELARQGARCMECGIPFCHWACTLGNIIPDFNDLVYKGRWKDALEKLLKTNNFPEFTGRVCPALCEDSCVLALTDPAVTIKAIELAIIEKGFAAGWMKPVPPPKRSDKTVAVIGSGPAGLACADQLNKAGHRVTVYEKNEVIGGLLARGIPDFKLEKSVIERRVRLMEKEGVTFKVNARVGGDIPVKDLTDEFDAVVLSGGAEAWRDLPVEGRELKGVYQAMEYLTQQNRINAGQTVPAGERIDVKGKNVVVLGGGDTGADCVGTANRQGARSVKQFELLCKPPAARAKDNPWPEWGRIYRRGTSHDEGVEQDYCVMTKRFSGQDGVLKKLHAARLEFHDKDPKTGKRPMREIEESAFEVDCDYVFLAMGFLGPRKEGMIEDLGVELDPRGNVKTDAHHMSSVPGVFAAGDMRTGQSLVLKAIADGRAAAEGVHRFLKAAKMKAA